MSDVQWWLAELDQHGNPTLCDGAHTKRAGADRAFYLHRRLRLGQGKRFAVARVELSEPVENPTSVDEDAIDTVNANQPPVSVPAAREGR